MTSSEIITIAQGVRQWNEVPGSHIHARIIGYNVAVHPLDGRSVHGCNKVLIALGKDDGSTFYTHCSRELFEMGWGH